LEENHMSITFDPTTLLYAIVEYLKSSDHIYDPVNTRPEQDGQYRPVCLAVNSNEAWRVANLLRALSDGTYWYSVCVSEPGNTAGEPLPISEPDIP
jgi:hypothetical protein